MCEGGTGILWCAYRRSDCRILLPHRKSSWDGQPQVSVDKSSPIQPVVPHAHCELPSTSRLSTVSGTGPLLCHAMGTTCSTTQIFCVSSTQHNVLTFPSSSLLGDLFSRQGVSNAVFYYYFNFGFLASFSFQFLSFGVGYGRSLGSCLSWSSLLPSLLLHFLAC